MNISTDKKLSTTTEKAGIERTSVAIELSDTTASASSKKARKVEDVIASFRSAIKAVDAQRTELVKNAIDNNKPGRTFDAGVIRQVNKLETARNRLLVNHFAWLLKNNPADVHAIVHQIIEL